MRERFLGYGFLAVVFGTGIGCERVSYQGRSLSSWTYDLNNDEPYKRRNACEAIAALGPKAAGVVDKVVPLVRDENPGVREFAAVALGKIGNAAKESIESLFSSDDPETRLHAARAMLLVDGSHDTARKFLMEALTGVGNAELSKAAQDIVVRGERKYVSLLGATLESSNYQPAQLQLIKTFALLREHGRNGISVLSPFVLHPKPEVRQAALRAVAAIGPREAVEPIIRPVLDDKDEQTAVTAAMMMKYIGAHGSATGYKAYGNDDAANANSD